MPERLYSTYQVADLLGTTPATVVDWMQKGLLSYSRMADGPVRVSEKGLIGFLKGRGVNIEDVLSLPDDSLVSEEFSPTSDHVSASAAERAARTALLDESPEMGGGEMTAEVAEIAELAEVVEDAELADAGEVGEMAPVRGSRTAGDLLTEAVAQGATQVHFLPTRDGRSVRVRIDGALRDMSAVASGALELSAQLDALAEAGPGAREFELTVDAATIRCRLATCPSLLGAAVVVHLRDPRRLARPIASLPLAEPERNALRAVAAAPGGLIVVAGPPRHGAGQVLWALAEHCNRPDRSLFVVDRSSWLRVDGAIQRRPDPDVAAALRDMAEMDADTVVAGDIPDPAAAAAAIDAARDGRLVLAATNTPTVAMAIERLFELGLDAWQLSTALIAVVAARAVPRLCDACKQPAKPDRALLQRAGLDPNRAYLNIFEGTGCSRCGDSGYRGRVLLLSILRTDPPVAVAIRTGMIPLTIAAAHESGFTPLPAVAAKALRNGTIDLETLADLSDQAGIDADKHR